MGRPDFCAYFFGAQSRSRVAKATDEFLERMEEGENGPNNNNSCKSQEEKQAARSFSLAFLALQVAKVFRQSMKGKQIKCCICITFASLCFVLSSCNSNK